jgi:amino acid transporter
MAGEIKSVTKNSIIGPLVGGALISGLVMTVGAYLMENVAGLNFLNSIAIDYSNGKYALPAPPYWNLLGSMLTNSLPLLVLIGIGFIAWNPMVAVADFMLDSRNMLAWGFDRVIPEKFTYVNPRTRTPIIALVVYLIGSLIILVMLDYWGSILAALSATLAQVGFTYIPAGLAAVLLPFRQGTKPIYEKSSIKRSIAGIPIITIVGILQLITMGWFTYMFAVNPAYGANSTNSLLAIFGVFIAGFVIYYASLFYNKNRGIDITLAFHELPPA